MITVSWLYALGGAMFAAFALLSALDSSNAKRWGNAAFWGLLALSFFAGDRLGDLGNGLLVVALVAIAGCGLLGRGDPPTTTAEQRTAFAARLGNRLFLPALIIPATAFLGTIAYNYTPFGESGIFEQRWVTLILLGLGAVIAIAVIMAWLRPPPLAPLQEGRRLMDSIGWAAVLPQMLAALGAVFALAGIGDLVGGIAGNVIPQGNLFAAVAVYALGMALFTMIMGNAFAAFPVMAAAIGIPLLVVGYGGNPAVIGAVGMLAGFCGTLMTPMAANFNIVPAALLELKDRNGVIKAQIGTALPLLVCNLLLIYFLAFR
ncbi:DUF979 domain-containing protein [Allosphingosinicella indica]|uniref:Uncharacterized membrane protein n=1 Tax=Allosphingosinicella indica TaxID=941907 RepID=A0A1X7G0Z1_9SPHN|nr:DUF979 domain-containing protein [Allosphingosinicella indica]SMF62045.1 Uncharacterized membrane protein [Allosphingosinicella indica]